MGGSKKMQKTSKKPATDSQIHSVLHSSKRQQPPNADLHNQGAAVLARSYAHLDIRALGQTSWAVLCSLFSLCFARCGLLALLCSYE